MGMQAVRWLDESPGQLSGPPASVVRWLDGPVTSREPDYLSLSIGRERLRIVRNNEFVTVGGPRLVERGTVGQVEQKSSGWGTFWTALSVAGTVLGAYHGYKRNNSVGWGVGWAILGGLFPFITIPLSLAQGFGRPK